MSDKTKAMVWASFAADSLALPAHWIYDTEVISERFGRPDTLKAPWPDSYHAGKQEGMFTHYGDQALWLLESVAMKKGFDLYHFARTWKKGFSRYDGYLDRATKITLENFARGLGPEKSGSPSTDLAGAARIAPIIYHHAGEPARCIAHCRAQTSMTHSSPAITGCAEFFASAVLKVLSNKKPTEALLSAKAALPAELVPLLESGLASADEDTISAIGRFGLSCDVAGAFPAVIHLVAKYQSDPVEGLVQNVTAGGDSAARGMVAGMFFGAFNGMDAVKPNWMSRMKAAPWMATLLDLGLG
ncbi:MAG: ADP-ribosylglycohydrolase family protein [Deltaproteobacteria bacterium]|nr:ADP-ribosylglycohydrolase family protein [Deltaproteobacteria bacterium]